MKKIISVLSIDGGGVRGIIPLQILKALEEKIMDIEMERFNIKDRFQCSHLAQKFDVIAGTSTGGIISLGLTVPNGPGSPMPKYRVDDLIRIYTEHAKHIFPKSKKRYLATMNGLFGPKYSNKGLITLLQQYFGDSRLSECTTNTIVTAYEIERYVPMFFKSSDAKNKPKHDFYAKDIARATSAAPTYFNPTRIRSMSGEVFTFVDGGVNINNPTMSALVEAKELFPDATDFLVVSIGTGKTSKAVLYEGIRNKGGIKWISKLIPIMMDGVSLLVDKQIRDILPPIVSGRAVIPRYFRFQPDISANINRMDDVKASTIRQLSYLGAQLALDRELDINIIATELCMGFVDRNAMTKIFSKRLQTLQPSTTQIMMDVPHLNFFEATSGKNSKESTPKSSPIIKRRKKKHSKQKHKEHTTIRNKKHKDDHKKIKIKIEEKTNKNSDKC